MKAQNWKWILFVLAVAVGTGLAIQAPEWGGENVAYADSDSEDSEDSDDDESDGNEIDSDSTLAKVLKRGKVRCGVNDSTPGFGLPGPDGKLSGFDIDFCHAIAAAVFGDADRVEFVPVLAFERFEFLEKKKYEVLIRNTTWTFARDTELPFDFTNTTFYDGQGIMVRANSGINSLADLEGKRIPVVVGSSTEKNLTKALEAMGVSYTQVDLGFDSNFFDAFLGFVFGEYDAVSTDVSALSGINFFLSDPFGYDPAIHKVLPEVISKEPLGPVVREGDDEWFDIVKWVVFATIQAEELGLTSENVMHHLDSDDQAIRLFLNLDPDEFDSGRMLGLPSDWTLQILKQVGNYGEIYERHLGEDSETSIFIPREGTLNQMYTEGGLLYSPPFR